MGENEYECDDCGMPVKQPDNEIFVYGDAKVIEPVCPNCGNRLDISIFDT